MMKHKLNAIINIFLYLRCFSPYYTILGADSNFFPSQFQSLWDSEVELPRQSCMLHCFEREFSGFVISVVYHWAYILLGF